MTTFSVEENWKKKEFKLWGLRCINSKVSGIGEPQWAINFTLGGGFYRGGTKEITNKD